MHQESKRGELRVVTTIIELARPIGVIIRKVHPHDKELADQLRRAWTSAANNATEGQHQRGNKRINRMDDAMGSARESRTSVLLAEAYGYVPAEIALPLAKQIDSCVAQLYRLANPR